jgi:hypothetical protein
MHRCKAKRCELAQHTHALTHTRTYTHTYTHKYTHKYTHAHTYTNAHTYNALNNLRARGMEEKGTVHSRGIEEVYAMPMSAISRPLVSELTEAKVLSLMRTLEVLLCPPSRIHMHVNTYMHTCTHAYTSMYVYTYARYNRTFTSKQACNDCPSSSVPSCAGVT